MPFKDETKAREYSQAYQAERRDAERRRLSDWQQATHYCDRHPAQVMELTEVVRSIWKYCWAPVKKGSPRTATRQALCGRLLTFDEGYSGG